MTTYNDRQYRSLPSADGTSTDDPLTVSAVRHLEWALNNAHRYAMRHKGRGQPLFPAWTSSAHTTERVIMVFAPTFLPDGYTYVRWYLGGSMASAGESCIWRLYASSGLYRGPDTMDAGRLNGGYAYDQISFTSASHDIKSSHGLRIVRDGRGRMWLVLTAQASNAAVTCSLTSFDWIPIVG